LEVLGMKVPAAPSGLSAEAKKLWVKILMEMGGWEESQLWIVRTGLEQWDLMQQARARVKKDGQMVADRFGQMKLHPLLSVIRDNAAGVRQTYKLLGLDFMEADE